ncbi:hypothetical protein F4824DRAFT_497354 [Ustulina deusta]|nr:hypothetical protein F4824DRAFT_497354 [Ustulina deusta]
MRKPEEISMSEGQTSFGSSGNPKTQTHCNDWDWDWDRLRMVKIKGTAKIKPPNEDVEVPILKRFVDYLLPKVRAVMVDNDLLISQVATDPQKDGIYILLDIPLS